MYSRIPRNTQHNTTGIHLHDTRIALTIGAGMNAIQYIPKYMYCDNRSKYMTIHGNTS